MLMEQWKRKINEKCTRHAIRSTKQLYYKFNCMIRRDQCTETFHHCTRFCHWPPLNHYNTPSPRRKAIVGGQYSSKLYDYIIPISYQIWNYITTHTNLIFSAIFGGSTDLSRTTRQDDCLILFVIIASTWRSRHLRKFKLKIFY